MVLGPLPSFRMGAASLPEPFLIHVRFWGVKQTFGFRRFNPVLSL